MRHGLRRALPLFFAYALFVSAASIAHAGPRALLDAAFPAPFGVNIHYTDGAPGETAMLGKAYRVVRMDFIWSATERAKGVYDFSAYDRLLRELDAQGLTPLFILDYGNDVYQQGPPRTPEAVAGYARWAAAAAKRYKGRRILWEFWNEPNLSVFWGNLPPSGDQYADIVLAAAAAMRAQDPDCTLLVGATSGFPWEFIETTLRRGVLQWADGFTVHPYRSGVPETVTADYQRLRALLHRYSPERRIPILSGEWGYSTNTKTGIPENRQAQYLVRQRLINISQDVGLSIWYDWKDDGPDPTENEHRFGSVTQDLKPKPAYAAASVMTETLAGYRFARLLSDGPNAYVMLLRNDRGETALALWTTGPEGRYALPDAATLVSMEGGRSRVAAGEEVVFGPSPAYALMGKSAAMDTRMLWWWVRPNTLATAGKRVQTPGITLVNPTAQARRYTLTVDVRGGTTDVPSVTLTVPAGERAIIPAAYRITSREPKAALVVTVSSAPANAPGETLTDTAEIPLTVANPLSVAAGPVSAGAAEVTLASFSGVPEDFLVTLYDTTGLEGARPQVVTLPAGQRRVVARIPVEKAEAAYSYGVRVQDQHGGFQSAPPVRFQPVPLIEGSAPGAAPLGLEVHGEGEEKPGGSATLTAQMDETRGVVADLRADFPDGWRYFVVTPTRKEIPNDAMAVGMWVKGDGSGDALRCRFVDAKGQVYQPTYGNVDWTGWRWITMPLDDPSVGSWGGPQDGVIHAPIRWDSVVLLDSSTQKAHSAHIRFSGITLIAPAG